MHDFAVFTPAGTEPDAGALTQMATCMDAGDALGGSLSADHHLGYSMPIGASIAYEDYLSPSGVGFDIGCGNKAVGTSLLYSDISGDLNGIMDEVARRISFGVGRPNNEPVDHPVLDRIRKDAPLGWIKNMQGLAAKQLGTVGAGNHYVDLFREEGTDRVWIGVHFGSRGFGHKIATGFLNISVERPWDDKPQAEGLYAPPALIHKDTPMGWMYVEAMQLAGEYAYAGRDTVVNTVLDILGNPSVTHEVHNHHNFAWLERHGGRDVWVVRKGATPLFPGQQGFVGGSMGENAVIIEGKGAEGTHSTSPHGRGTDWNLAHVAGAAALWSAPHGAGRAMSRTEAKGKSRKRWTCDGCGWTQGPGESAVQRFGGWICPECSTVLERKVWVQEQEGKIDWKAAQRDLVRKGIVLRGGEADEAPGAYKRLPAVLAAHRDYVEVVHDLRPIGVAMAGPGTTDPYKD